jgi:hypothetical protein
MLKSRWPFLVCESLSPCDLYPYRSLTVAACYRQNTNGSVLEIHSIFLAASLTVHASPRLMPFLHKSQPRHDIVPFFLI